MLAEISTVVPCRLIRKLVDVEVYIAIKSDIRGVGPDDPRSGSAYQSKIDGSIVSRTLDLAQKALFVM